MKKYLIVTLLGVMVSGAAAGCGMNNDNMNEQGMNDNDALERVGYDRDRTGDYMNVNDAGTRDSVRENYSLSKEAANNVADLKEVKRAYVLTTERNAYVAAVLENGENGVSQQLEDKVAKQIRNVDAGIENVYVSTNPDFFDRMRGYADRAENGEPIEGFGEELMDVLQRVFPDRN